MTWKSSLEVVPTSPQCVRYCSHSVSHRCGRKASVESLSTTAKKRGWSFNCQRVSVRGMCFTEHIFPCVLGSNASIWPILKILQWNTQLTLFRWGELFDIQQCQSAVLKHMLKTNFCNAPVNFTKFTKDKRSSSLVLIITVFSNGLFFYISRRWLGHIRSISVFKGKDGIMYHSNKTIFFFTRRTLSFECWRSKSGFCRGIYRYSYLRLMRTARISTLQYLWLKRER